MKNLISKNLFYIFTFMSLLFTACQKSGNSTTNNTDNGNKTVTNTYNISLSAANKNYDTVAVDVDNDKVNDFTIFAYNSTYDEPRDNVRTIQACYIYSLQDSTLIATTNKFANYYWSRLYNFGGDSQLFNYVGGFNAGDLIGAVVPSVKTAGNYSTITNAFESVGNSWDCTSSYVYESPQYAPFTYNESEGYFLNATQYIGFTIKKADGRHYGWIKLANSNSCLNIQVISSGYSTLANQSITAN